MEILIATHNLHKKEEIQQILGEKYHVTSLTDYNIHEEIIELCQSIIKELGSRTFQLRDIIQWERFISGVH